MDIKQTAVLAIEEAGAVIRKLCADTVKFKAKNAYDIVAEADVESEKIIIDYIKRDFPSHSILAEESGAKANNSEFRWIIDPLDGTINFSRDLDEFCISIAVEKSGKLILGLIYEPLKNNLYSAEVGQGAWLNSKRLCVSQESRPINAILATDNSSNIETRLKNYTILKNVCTEFRHIRIFGSAALHLAKIASGKIDAYYKTKANYWDYAAGILLVQEAGGIVTDFAGQPISEKSGDIIASNLAISSEVIKLLNRQDI